MRTIPRNANRTKLLRDAADDPELRHATLSMALSVARGLERAMGARLYVVWCALDSRWVVQADMPYFGTWYTSDGVRHG